MKKVDTIANFKTINEDIKAKLHEIDEHLAAHPYFDYSALNKNNELFREVLDQLFEARCTIEELKSIYLLS